MNNFYKKKENPEYRMSPYRIGAQLTIQSANQIQDMGKRLNEGIKNIEVSAISPEISGGIPTEHFKEMKRLSELTDSKVSVHAPIIDPAGFKENRWSEQERLNNEEEFRSIIERANLLGKNTPVVIHGANVMSQEWDKEIEEKYRKEIEEEEKKLEKIKKIKKIRPEEVKVAEEALREEKKKIMPRMMTVVNQETGELRPIEFEERERFTKTIKWFPEERLRNLNETDWDKHKLDVLSRVKEIDELEEKKQKLLSSPFIRDYEKAMQEGRKEIIKEEDKNRYMEYSQKANLIDDHIEQINQHINTAVEDIYHRLKKFGEDDKEIKSFLESDKYKESREVLKNIDEYYKRKIIQISEDEVEKRDKLRKEHLNQRAKALSNIITVMPKPQVWVSVKDFSIKKAAETFSSLALKSYKEYGEDAPIIAIENSYPNMPLSRAEELKKAIDLSREKFVDNLVRDKKLSKEKAKKVAEKILGATWDVGHINMLRKAGYSEKEIIEEARKIGKDVKHIHLSDNFGSNDTHLPPGMGNVPIKETLKALEEKGDMEGIRAIVEAGNFVQHFKQSPYPYALEYLGSPLYKFGETPYWSNLPEQNLTPAGEYFMGYGDILPEFHFKKLYGAGFSGLPRELGGGGEGGGDKGRFASGGEQ